VIQTLAITIVIEGAICLVYAVWQKKPIGPILITSVLANLITQSLLWIVLNIFYQHYLVTLLIAEILIWLIEGLLFYVSGLNRLNAKESLLLSLLMNLSSFGLGLVLPI
jgi:hypothetical protein